MEEIEFNKSAINPGDCIGMGWRLVTGNFATYLGVAVVGLIIYIVASFIGGLIPFVGPFIIILVSAPLLGGFYCIAISDVDGEASDFGMMFRGFEKIGPLSVLALIQAIPSIVLMILALTGQLAVAYGLPLPAGTGSGYGSGVDPRLLSGVPALMIVLMIVWIIFSIFWALIFFFSTQLIMDRDLGAIEAITTSARAAFSNAGGVIVLMILTGLVAILGALALCLGLFVAIPIAWVAAAAAYRSVFPRTDESRWTTPPPPSTYGSIFNQ